MLNAKVYAKFNLRIKRRTKVVLLVLLFLEIYRGEGWGVRGGGKSSFRHCIHYKKYLAHFRRN
jgi:hypothetical protein